jgi:hypothetical protein
MGFTHLDFAEDKLVPEPVLNKTTLETRFFGTNCHFKHAGFDATSLFSAILDLVEDAIEEARHGGEDGGGKFLKVLSQFQDITTEEADGSSSIQKGDLCT